jgi:predicted RNA polymerase sigma factor
MRRDGRLGALGAPPYLWNGARCQIALLISVRGDLLRKLGRFDEAREFQRAASLTRNAREHQRLLDRAAACAQHAVPAERS